MVLGDPRSALWHWSLAAQERYDRGNRALCSNELSAAFSSTIEGFEEYIPEVVKGCEASLRRKWERKFVGLALALARKVRSLADTTTRKALAQDMKQSLKRHPKDYRYYLLAANVMMLLDMKVAATKILAATSLHLTDDFAAETLWSTLKYELEQALCTRNEYGSQSIGALPKEVASTIFGKLELQDLKACRLVCKEWYHILHDLRLLFRTFRHRAGPFDQRAIKRLELSGPEGPEDLELVVAQEWPPSPTSARFNKLKALAGLSQNTWHCTKSFVLKFQLIASPSCQTLYNEPSTSRELLLDLNDMPTFPNLQNLTCSIHVGNFLPLSGPLPFAIRLLGDMAERTPRMSSFTFSLVNPVPNTSYHGSARETSHVDFDGFHLNPLLHALTLSLSHELPVGTIAHLLKPPQIMALTLQNFGLPKSTAHESIACPMDAKLKSLTIVAGSRRGLTSLSSILAGQDKLERFSLQIADDSQAAEQFLELLAASASHLRSFSYMHPLGSSLAGLKALLCQSSNILDLTLDVSDSLDGIMEHATLLPHLRILRLRCSFMNCTISSAALCGFVKRRMATLRRIIIHNCVVQTDALDWITGISSISLERSFGEESSGPHHISHRKRRRM